MRAHQCLNGLAPSATDFIPDAAKRDAKVTGSLRVSAANPLRELLEEYGKRKNLPTLAVDVDFGNATPMEYRCLDRVEARRMLAEAAATTRNHDYAAKLYEEVLAENPEDVDALVGLSYVSDDLGRALELARRALAVDPDHPEAIDRVAELEANE